MTVIQGVHPYAEEFPLASDEELEELAQSVATVGLIHPLVVIGTVEGVEDGRLADGRNRRTACQHAGVEPTVEVRDFETDDELKEFIIGVNTTGRRDSMTVQIAAASTALILGEGKRKNGRWERNTITRNSGLYGKTELDELRRAGLILDQLGREGLEAVRDGRANLNAKYEEATRARDAEESKREYEQRMEAEEADAKAFIQEQAPDYADRVKSGELSSYAVAKTEWEQDNRKRAADLRWQQAEKERTEAEERDNAQQRAKTAADAHYRLHALTVSEHRARVVEAFRRYHSSVPNLHRNAFTPNYVRETAQSLHALAEEMEASDD